MAIPGSEAGGEGAPDTAKIVLRYDDGSPAVVEGDFDKRKLDADYVRERETLMTRGWRRLREVAHQEDAIINYPLPEVRARIDADYEK